MEIKIREIRKNKGLSGTKIANLLHISSQYYYDLEKGDRSLSFEMALNIASILEEDVNNLIEVDNDACKSENNNRFDFLNDKTSMTLDGETVNTRERKALIAFLRTYREMG
ncbi:helix-turn-helix transcriptional regulator [Virgibacillus sp. M23]|uniref:helix-turn-helix transcriptional regulator n=1 Tax=Virgibacillus sp. M23 TaxID=3079030 RepID=UPI002A912EDD|nr:helix-turn-helix transcriptional regulator [Virgibacillus sp. M23]MDY7043631.1 helix-turn-helix transcriptional regulator [Virgibacillus sp. M23]